jgi:uncharacterized coiled-coil protein SlyX
MLGFSIISSKELQRLQALDSLYPENITKIVSLEKQVRNQNDVIEKFQRENDVLTYKLGKFDRKRVNGKFVKSTI